MDKFVDIYNKVAEHYRFLESKGYEVVFTALQGSQNYGLDEYSDEYVSDVDTKSVVLPSFEDFCNAKPPVSTVEHIYDELGRDTHAEVKDIRTMFEMFLKENISYIELLYSKYVIVNPKYQWMWDELMKVRDWVAGYDVKQFVKCIAGMAYEKQKALCHPYPSVASKIASYGYDGKQLSHAARLLIFLTMYYVGGLSIEQCYKVPDMYKNTLMNYKKQLDEEGKPLSCERAIELMDDFVNRIKGMKDAIVGSNEYGVNEHVRDFLNNLKVEVLKQWFLELMGK